MRKVINILFVAVILTGLSLLCPGDGIKHEQTDWSLGIGTGEKQFSSQQNVNYKISDQLSLWRLHQKSDGLIFNDNFEDSGYSSSHWHITRSQANWYVTGGKLWMDLSGSHPGVGVPSKYYVKSHPGLENVTVMAKIKIHKMQPSYNDSGACAAGVAARINGTYGYDAIFQEDYTWTYTHDKHFCLCDDKNQRYDGSGKKDNYGFEEGSGACWYWMKLKVQGSGQYAKVWKVVGESEPGWRWASPGYSTYSSGYVGLEGGVEDDNDYGKYEYDDFVCYHNNGVKVTNSSSTGIKVEMFAGAGDDLYNENTKLGEGTAVSFGGYVELGPDLSYTYDGIKVYFKIYDADGTTLLARTKTTRAAVWGGAEFVWQGDAAKGGYFTITANAGEENQLRRISTGKLWYDNFEDGDSEGWYTDIGSGYWYVGDDNGNKVFKETAENTSEPCHAYVPSVDEDRVYVVAKVKVKEWQNGDACRVGVCARMQTSGDYKGLGYNALLHNTKDQFQLRVLEGDGEVWGQAVSFPWRLNEWYYIKLLADESAGSQWQRGKIWRAKDVEPTYWMNLKAANSATGGRCGLTVGSATGQKVSVWFDDVSIYKADPIIVKYLPAGTTVRIYSSSGLQAQGSTAGEGNVELNTESFTSPLWGWFQLSGGANYVSSIHEIWGGDVWAYSDEYWDTLTLKKKSTGKLCFDDFGTYPDGNIEENENWARKGGDAKDWKITTYGGSKVLKFGEDDHAPNATHSHAYYKKEPYSNVVVTAKVCVPRWDKQTESKARVGVSARLLDGETGYNALIHQRLHDGTITRFRLHNDVDDKWGSPEDIDDDKYNINEWFWIKLKVSGNNNQRAKIWRLAEDEPPDWRVSKDWTDRANGYVGLMGGGPSVWVDYWYWDSNWPFYHHYQSWDPEDFEYVYDDFACYSPGPIVVKNLNKDEVVKLFDLSGHLLNTAVADGTGTAYLRVSDDYPNETDRHPVTFPLQGGGYFVVEDKNGNVLYRTDTTYDIWGGDTWESVETRSAFASMAPGVNDNWLISRTLDFGTTIPIDYDVLKWNADVPEGTEIKFQLATNNDQATWTYTGPSGADSYYIDPDGAFIVDEEGRYLRYKVFLNSYDTFLTPTLYDVLIQSNPGAPEAIDDLVAAARENTVFVDLNWTKPSGGAQGGADYYKIYRSKYPFGESDIYSVEVSTLNDYWQETSYCDTDIMLDNSPGKHYYYAVFSVDKKGQESHISNLAEATFLLDDWHIPANAEPFASRGDTMRDPLQPAEDAAVQLWVGDQPYGASKNIVAQYKLKAQAEAWSQYPYKLLDWTTAQVLLGWDYYLAEYFHPDEFAKGTTVQYYFKTRLQGPSMAEHPVISEIAVAGGVGQFVELYNPTAQDISLKQWSIQYKKAGSDQVQKTNFGGSDVIEAYRFFLCAKSGFDGEDLAYGFDLSLGSGTVFLVNDNHFISDPHTDPNIVDKVGFGSADVHEQYPALWPPTGGSIERNPGRAAPAAGNGEDTDNNKNDFEVRTAALGPEPQNSSADQELSAAYQEPTYICTDISVGKRTTHNLAYAEANPFAYLIDNTAPNRPRLISPGTTYPYTPVPDTIAIQPEFKWEAPADPDGDAIALYWVQVATSADFANPKYDADWITGTVWQGASLDVSTTYFWQARAKDASSYNPYWSDWSETFWFVTASTYDFLLTEDYVENPLTHTPFGTTASTFTYWVTYKNYANAAPAFGYPKVLIYDEEGQHLRGLPREMDEYDSADTNYMDGKIYYYNIVLGEARGDYAFKYEAKVGAKYYRTGLQHNPKVGPDLEQILLLCKDPDMFGDVDHENIGLSPAEDEELSTGSDAIIEAEAIPDDEHEYSGYILTCRYILNGIDRKSKQMSLYQHGYPVAGRMGFRCTLANGVDIHNGDQVKWWVTGRDADSLTDEIQTSPTHTFYLTENFVNCWHKPTTSLKDSATTYYRLPLEITPFSSVIMRLGAEKGKISSAVLYYTTDGSDPDLSSDSIAFDPERDGTQKEQGVDCEYWKLHKPLPKLSGGTTVQYFIKATFLTKDDTYLRSNRVAYPNEGSEAIAYPPTSQFFQFYVTQDMLDIYHIPSSPEPDVFTMRYAPNPDNWLKPRRYDPITFTLGNLVGATTSHDIDITMKYRKRYAAAWESTSTFSYTTSISNASTTDYYAGVFKPPGDIPLNDYIRGTTIQYYFKATHTDCLDTYVFGNDNTSYKSYTESQAEGDPFEYIIVNTKPEILTGLHPPTTGNPEIEQGEKTFYWSAGTDADGDSLTYNWELSSGSPDNVIRSWSGSETSHELTDLDYIENIPYWWRVRAWDGIEYGEWAELSFYLKGSDKYIYNVRLVDVTCPALNTDNPSELQTEKRNTVSNADDVTIEASVYLGSAGSEMRFYYSHAVKDKTDEYGHPIDYVITEVDNSNPAQQSNYFSDLSQLVTRRSLESRGEGQGAPFTWKIPRALLTPYPDQTFEPGEEVDSGRLWIQICGKTASGEWVNSGGLIKLLVNRSEGDYEDGDHSDEVFDGSSLYPEHTTGGGRNYMYPIQYAYPNGPATLTGGQSLDKNAENNFSPIWHDNKTNLKLTQSAGESKYYLATSTGAGLIYGDKPTIYLRASYKDISGSGEFPPADLKFRYSGSGKYGDGAKQGLYQQEPFAGWWSASLQQDKDRTCVRDDLQPYELCFDFWKTEGAYTKIDNPLANQISGSSIPPNLSADNLPEGGKLQYHFRITDGNQSVYFDNSGSPKGKDSEATVTEFEVEILQDDSSKPVTYYDGSTDAQDPSIHMIQQGDAAYFTTAGEHSFGNWPQRGYWDNPATANHYNPYPDAGAPTDADGKANEGMTGRTGESYRVYCWLRDTKDGGEEVWRQEGFNYELTSYPYQTNKNENTAERGEDSGVVQKASDLALGYRTARGDKWVPATLCYYYFSSTAYKDDDLDGCPNELGDSNPYERGKIPQLIRINGVDGETSSKWDGYVLMSRREPDKCPNGNGEWFADIPVSMGDKDKYLYYRIWACNGDWDPQAYARNGDDLSENATPYTDGARDHDADYGWVTRTIYAGKILPVRYVIITARAKVSKTVKWMKTYLQVVHPIKVDKDSKKFKYKEDGSPDYDTDKWVVGRIVSQEIGPFEEEK